MIPFIYVARKGANFSVKDTANGKYYPVKRGQYFYVAKNPLTEGQYMWTWDSTSNRWVHCYMQKLEHVGTSDYSINLSTNTGLPLATRLDHYAAEMYGGKWGDKYAQPGYSVYVMRYNTPIYNHYGGFTRSYLPKGSLVRVDYGCGSAKGTSERDIRLINVNAYKKPGQTSWQNMGLYYLYDPARDWAPSMYNLNTY